MRLRVRLVVLQAFAVVVSSNPLPEVLDGAAGRRGFLATCVVVALRAIDLALGLLHQGRYWRGVPLVAVGEKSQATLRELVFGSRFELTHSFADRCNLFLQRC